MSASKSGFRKLARIGAGGRVLHGVGGDALRVALLHPHLGQRVGNFQRLAEVENPVEHAVEIGLREIEDARHERHLGGDGIAIGEHHIGKHHPVRHAVMRVVASADRMRHRMDRAEALLEGGRAHRGGREHIGARLEIAARSPPRAADRG